MGLPNVKSVADDFTIESGRNGTTVVCTIELHPNHEEE
ncbi:hypothetical protein SDC9_105727 [bioreactor metagenome]|uniref:Uncharacterized protein n=1 Tax=bioreactor metagenome TaxID=1076179 RepID=A0A645BB25_9ZZZZ